MDGFFNPRIFQGEAAALRDPMTMEIVSIEEIKNCIGDYHHIFYLLHDWENRMFTVSMKEYLELPAKLKMVMALYQNYKAKYGQ